MVRHWQGYNLAKCNNFSSSSRVHSVFFIDGSNHSYHRALHCFADFLLSNEATRAHWFLPYFMTAAFKISSSVFFHTPPLIMILMVASGAGARGRPVQFVGGVARRRGAAGGATSAWGGAQSSASRPARLGHLLSTAPRGGGASSCDERRLCGAGRVAHACQSALRCAASLFYGAVAFLLLCFLVSLRHARSKESALAYLNI